MKELKFRAWNKEKKHWLEEFEFAISGEGETFLYAQGISEDGFMRLTEDLEIIQYTGLKDKNNKEIYEGDIFRFVYSFDRDPVREWDSLVVFESCCFGWIPLHTSLRYDDDRGFHPLFSRSDDAPPTNIEIIGNKFEHPELLGERLSI